MLSSKEALNLLFCTSEGLPEHKVYECQKILQQELDLLTKYKRAFEILKEKFNLRLIPLLIVGDEVKSMCLDYTGDYRRPLIPLDDEEAKLLEELMKGE